MRLLPVRHFRFSPLRCGLAAPPEVSAFFPSGLLPGGVPAPFPVPGLLRASSPALRQRLNRSVAVFESFVTPEEETELLRDAERALRRKPYQDGHWDGAISCFREAELCVWSPRSLLVLQRMAAAFPTSRPPTEYGHVLDIAERGEVRAHVDSVKFCGCTIVGLSLLSAAVMRLRGLRDPHEWVELLLEPRSLYVLRSEARYGFTHEILGGAESFFGSLHVPRRRRLAIIRRNTPQLMTPN
ncbi:alpha-ketoglutarate-dependent dioxygenase alkB homolog 7, mitochondrial [Coturnix japonica]|uniref:alpha-ketoglutarate-dependent dioxygenase alkB homolog 7, mitochondrial n=1 Tax=Coturnix japonica TaxID=93934 RepID=UPI000777BA18|nr:alpha-ketoglutarate-dependent dioxygenase alkB homolog 7, mitochondrial [Coturnix japonica]